MFNLVSVYRQFLLILADITVLRLGLVTLRQKKRILYLNGACEMPFCAVFFVG